MKKSLLKYLVVRKLPSSPSKGGIIFAQGGGRFSPIYSHHRHGTRCLEVVATLAPTTRVSFECTLLSPLKHQKHGHTLGGDMVV